MSDRQTRANSVLDISDPEIRISLISRVLIETKGKKQNWS